jgi:hypothetical protein
MGAQRPDSRRNGGAPTDQPFVASYYLLSPYQSYFYAAPPMQRGQNINLHMEALRMLSIVEID